jgi:hypothetical protein
MVTKNAYSLNLHSKKQSPVSRGHVTPSTVRNERQQAALAKTGNNARIHALKTLNELQLMKIV